ncbi:hypothetical protein C9374_002934 [Naegleria lovaniensis]|uniref:Uncharacterized protein n=1 Tax=Naegleria lovaniensis TaxID=51637 RepID=A0AA88GS01_NAELO|nr:uncharacterized protein C9374_002934 [Naegleria lovaniensis]KAG2385785.1 hypothetical protein C9374_002934 [Naegleria lovaniensis]
MTPSNNVSLHPSLHFEQQQQERSKSNLKPQLVRTCSDHHPTNQLVKIQLWDLIIPHHDSFQPLFDHVNNSQTPFHRDSFQPWCYQLLRFKMSPHTPSCPPSLSRLLNGTSFSCHFHHVHSFHGNFNSSHNHTCWNSSNSTNTNTNTIPSNSTSSISFQSPYDVKISYSLHCILISDYLDRSIHVFELNSKQYRSTLRMQLHNPKFLCIAESYTTRMEKSGKFHSRDLEDALIMDVGRGRIRMFDLRRLLTRHAKSVLNNEHVHVETRTFSQHDALDGNENSSPNYIWQSNDFKFPRGIQVSMEIGHVFLSRIEISRPHAVDLLISHDAKNSFQNLTLVVSSDQDGIQILTQSLHDHSNSSNLQFMNSSWIRSSIRFEEERLPDDDDYGPIHPFSLVVDKVGNPMTTEKHVVVSDSYHHRMKVYSLHTGKLVKTFGKFGEGPSNEFKCTFGLCLNEWSGELLVCD